ncbi:MAG: hypothetical protein DHS20C02_15390 [Micavibrio sp.]|nr:MAG: hypothetical protein DHS20C02_15390 [Micavibrio sp.]
MRLGLIKIDEKEAGLALILESGILGNALHAFVLDRGPLWFGGFGIASHSRLFFEQINRQFPRRLGRRRRIIPELNDNEETQNIMKSLGYRRMYGPGYETIWLDLGQSPEELMADMNQNWRRNLKKAKELGLKVVWDSEGQYSPWFLKVHGLDKAKRGYDGPEPDIVKALTEKFAAEGDILLGRAMLNDKAVAAMLILCHGHAATYQAGWSGKEGRTAGAHHLLFFEAFSALKEKGIRDFDLGGVNDKKAAGVKKFKLGSGGKLVKLAGHYT